MFALIKGQNQGRGTGCRGRVDWRVILRDLSSLIRWRWDRVGLRGDPEVLTG